MQESREWVREACEMKWRLCLLAEEGKKEGVNKGAKAGGKRGGDEKILGEGRGSESRPLER